MQGDALARQVNARIREIAVAFGVDGFEDSPVSFVCECGCLQIVPLTLAAYSSLQGEPLLHGSDG